MKWGLVHIDHPRTLAPWKLMILKHGHGRGSKDLAEVTGEVDLKISGSKEIVLNKV